MRHARSRLPTPEMLEAGVMAYLTRSSDVESEEAIVARIFESMVGASPSCEVSDLAAPVANGDAGKV